MDKKNHTGITQTGAWIGLVLILIAIGPAILGFQPQTPAQLFAYGVLTGLVIAYLVVFIYQAGSEYSRKHQ